MSSISLSQWLSESQKYRSESTSLGNKIKLLLLQLSDNQELIAGCKKYDKSLIELHQLLRKKLNYFKRNISSLKLTLSKPTSDGDNIQKLIDSIEDNFSAFKHSMKSEYDVFLAEERALIDELKLFDETLMEIESSAKPSTNHPMADERTTKQVIQEHAENLDKEISNRALIGNIDRQLSSLGRTGGWDYRDQDLFLKVITQLNVDIVTASVPQGEQHDEVQDNFTYNTVAVQVDLAGNKSHIYKLFSLTNRAIFVKKLSKLLPGFSQDDLEKHVDWHIKYTKLQDIKKELLHEWKQNKQREAVSKIEEGLNFDVVTAVTSPHSSKATQGNIDDPDVILQNIIRQDEKKQMKEKIEQWKRTKRQEEDMKKVGERQEEEARKRQEQDALFERNEVLKHQLRKWKEENVKSNTPEQSSTATVEKRRASVDPAEVMRRRVLAVEAGKDRLTKVQNKRQESTTRQRKQKEMEDQISTKVYAGITRDPTRLYSSAKVSEAQRIQREQLDEASSRRQSASAHSKPIAMSARDIRQGVRAMPTWCKNVF